MEMGRWGDKFGSANYSPYPHFYFHRLAAISRLCWNAFTPLLECIHAFVGMALAFQQRIYWRINDVGNVKWNSGVNAVGRLWPFQQRRGG